jgi:hypothetical protein
MRFTLMFCHLTRYQGRLDPQASSCQHMEPTVDGGSDFAGSYVINVGKTMSFLPPIFLGMVSLYHL